MNGVQFAAALRELRDRPGAKAPSAGAGVRNADPQVLGRQPKTAGYPRIKRRFDGFLKAIGRERSSARSFSGRFMSRSAAQVVGRTLP